MASTHRLSNSLLGQIRSALSQKELARKSFEQARTILAAAVAKDPKEPLTHGDLAIVDAGLGLPDEALREANRAIDLQPIDKEPYFGPGWLAKLAEDAQLGRTDEAIKLARAIARDTEYRRSCICVGIEA